MNMPEWFITDPESGWLCAAVRRAAGLAAEREPQRVHAHRMGEPCTDACQTLVR